MKKFYTAAAGLFLGLCATAQAQFAFDPKIEIEDWEPTTVVLPPSPLKSQVLFVGQHHEVQTLDENGNPNGTALAKQWHDFLGFTPDNNSDDLGWISVNHEMILADDKIGDGGGMTVFKVTRDAEADTLVVVEQTLEDGRQGKFFNVDFKSTVGETGMNCGGITSTVDGRIWTAEEWFRSNNASIYADGEGVRDTTDWTISSDIAGNFDGTSIKRFENFNWMVEIDPRQAKAIRKQYNWGRQPYEGGCVLPDNKTVFTGGDNTPGLLTKFVADTPGDFTKGTTYVYKQSADGESGEWIEMNNEDVSEMLNFQQIALSRGATMFNRLEWVVYDKTNGKVYMTETGRDNPGGRFAGGTALGGVHAAHTLARAAEQGVSSPDDSEYWDYYGRVLVFDPETNKVDVLLEGGPYLPNEPAQAEYPETHLSNPDGLGMFYHPTGTYLLINEDLNGTSMGRTPAGISNRTCELYLLDLSKEASIDNLVRIAAVPKGAEITGAMGLDENTIIFNSQHPSSDNPFPYNNSLTVAVSGWVQAVASLEDGRDALENANGFTIYPNPTSRELQFNMVTDVAIYNAQGQRIRVARNTKRVNVEDLTPGVYFVKNKEGQMQKLIIE